ncbi:hypothetical protein [Bacillus paranthracis]|jgi:hypothetical protein|uniref:hypothetical protein n=1 Tax=Bacillus paranthracis TaxID=2026186 RepID=UPI0010156A0F|nr:hypothetical protein [Bacillus paranthracis]MDR4145014.1 hypothetical protein [Bacillus paranthracis]MDR4392474.1 hypothetical protein [Bacillus paranthracis]GCF71034.1 hypothetical protein BC2903_48530 [Bacillus cereus]
MNTLEQILFTENYAQVKTAVGDLEYMQNEEILRVVQESSTKLDGLFEINTKSDQVKVIQELLGLKERLFDTVKNISKLQERFNNEDYYQEILKLINSMKTSVTTSSMILSAMEFETMLSVLKNEKNIIYINQLYSLLGDIQDGLLIWCEQ